MRTRFDPTNEALFEDDYAERTLKSVRFGFILGATLYALFALLDLWMLPHSWKGAHLIRFGIVVPVCFVAVASTFFPVCQRHLQKIASIMVVVAGLGIVAMIVLADEREPGFRYYYAGLLLVITFSFSVVRLRFLATAMCCFVIITAYLLVAVFDQHLLADGLLSGTGPVFLNNGFFLIAEGIIALMGSFLMEDYARRNFLRREELSRALDELRATETQLIQSERTAAMVNVVAGLLHELNNPVGAITSASDVVSRGVQKLEDLLEAPSPAQRKTIDLIDESADVVHLATKRVTNALAVLKRFSHLDKAETADCDINEALEDCLSLLAHETGGRITVKKDFDVLPVIRCRPSEINQLFMSILKNAVEAIHDSGTIELRTSLNDGVVRVDITDTGVGIDRERLAQLFSPHFSHGGSRVKLGFGLVTAQRVVQQHGGTLDIESEVGEGTHVTLTLPLGL